MPRHLALLLVLAGCAEPVASVELAIDLRTDLEPSVDFTTIETRLDDAASAPRRWDPPGFEALLRGARVAEYDGLAKGGDVLEVRLLDARDREVGYAEAEVPLDVDRGVRLEIRAPRVVAGSRATCVIADARRQCWGSPAYFEVGRRVDEVVRPTVVDEPPIRDACLASFHEGCTVFSDGSLECYATPGEPDPSTRAAYEGADLARVVCGGVFGALHRCHLDVDGALGCSGLDGAGQLGIGGRGGTSLGSPDVVEGVARADQIAAGAVHACALVGGEVWCWGQNADGRTGDRTMVDRPTPAAVEGLGSVRAIAAGARHTCALGEDGRVTCWGWNGTHGVSPSDDEAVLEPFVRDDVADVVEVTGGGGHTCTRSATGDVRCWGANERGQLGDGTTTDRAEAIDVPLDGPAISISAGFAQTCAILEGDPPRVFCWGSDELGQSTGRASTTNRTTPVEVELAAPLYSSSQ